MTQYKTFWSTSTVARNANREGVREQDWLLAKQREYEKASGVKWSASPGGNGWTLLPALDKRTPLSTNVPARIVEEVTDAYRGMRKGFSGYVTYFDAAEKSGLDFHQVMEAVHWLVRQGKASVNVDRMGSNVLFKLKPESTSRMSSELLKVARDVLAIGFPVGDFPSSKELDQHIIDSLRQEFRSKVSSGRGTIDAKDVDLKVYRVGSLDDPLKRGVYFSEDRKGAEQYAMLHPGFQVEEYVIHLDKVLIAGHQNDVSMLFWGKPYGPMMDDLGRKNKSEGKGGQAFDRMIRREALRRGYSGVVYVKPAGPATGELGIFDKKIIKKLRPMGKAATEILRVAKDLMAAVVMTEDEYLESKGAGMSSLGEFGLHRYPRRPAESQQRRQDKQTLKQQAEWQSARDKYREEYRQKVMDGEIRPPSRTEKLLQTAKGMSEREDVQAARRILRKMGLWNDEMDRKILSATKTASLKTWSEIRDEQDPGGKGHDLRLTCDVCGNVETCRCSKPKREFHGICYDCAEKKLAYKGKLAMADTFRKNQQYDTDHFPKRLTPTWDMPTLGDEPLSEITTTWRSVNPMERGKHLMMSKAIKIAVSELPNDVLENDYPQEYMSPSPGAMGSVRPGDDIMLTGRTRRGKL